ncbi:MAG: Crp/Fnr family transcriptional regulator [Flavobacterium sp.]
MTTGFEKYLIANTALSESEAAYMAGVAEARSLRRNDLLLSPGDVSRHKIFVVSGLLRTYGIDAQGNEHILQFSPENTWTLDVESYDKETPSSVHIGAIEPTEVLLWQKQDFEALRNELPLLRKLSEELISRNIYYSRHRMLSALSATPEERYDDFIQRFPTLLQRLPLRMIAAYLGISVKTLTRVRHAQLQR